MQQALNILSYFSSNTPGTDNEQGQQGQQGQQGLWQQGQQGLWQQGQQGSHEPQEPPTKRARIDPQEGCYGSSSNNGVAPIAPRPNMGGVAWGALQQHQQQHQHHQQTFNPAILSSMMMVRANATIPIQPLSFAQHAHHAHHLAPLPAPPMVVDEQQAGSNNNDDDNDDSRKRKQINAMHARNARERKKNLMATLEMEQHALQEENRRLRALVKTHIPDRAQTIIGECSYKPRGKGLFHGASSSKLVSSDFDLIETLTMAQQSFVLTNPRLPDNPIVYASCSFLNMTGYTRDGVIGRNCRLLQGLRTSHDAVEKVREATKTGNDVSLNLLNYKEDGTPFWNHLFIAALRDKEGNIVNFVSAV
jgi:PAS domain S-box-containing protein